MVYVLYILKQDSHYSQVWYMYVSDPITAYSYKHSNVPGYDKELLYFIVSHFVWSPRLSS